MSFATTQPAARNARPRPWQFSLLRLLIWFIALGVLSTLGREAWMAIRSAGEVARCSSCLGHHKQLAVALHYYHDEWGSFPPAYTMDAAGRPMHSWRVLILPYIEKQTLYARYNFAEPWNGPNNIQLASEMPRTFCCPSCEAERAAGETSYVAIVGPDTAWPGASSRGFSDCPDKSALLIVETHDSGISWLEPRDLELKGLPLRLNPDIRPAMSSRHPGKVNYSTIDAQCRTLQENQLSPAQLKALITVADDD